MLRSLLELFEYVLHNICYVNLEFMKVHLLLWINHSGNKNLSFNRSQLIWSSKSKNFLPCKTKSTKKGMKKTPTNLIEYIFCTNIYLYNSMKRAWLWKMKVKESSAIILFYANTFGTRDFINNIVKVSFEKADHIESNTK